jgi:hypothetical protein
LNAWVSILLIEHIPDTMKRASIFTNPATKSMTSSSFNPKSSVGKASFFPNATKAASYSEKTGSPFPQQSSESSGNYKK